MEIRPIADIKAEYPDPEMAGNDLGGSDDYCGGGAVCMAHGLADLMGNAAFPEGVELSHWLQTINPSLPRGQAQYLARAIIDANDHANFEGAWAYASQALTWTQEDAECP